MNCTEKLDGKAGRVQCGARHDLQQRVHFDHVKADDAALGRQCLEKLEDPQVIWSTRLRRPCGGYADVGADIHAALGVVGSDHGE